LVPAPGVSAPPVLSNIEASALSYTENAPATAITATLTVADLDDTNIESAAISITSNFATGQDVLAFTNQNGITGTYNSGTGILTLTGSATKANYQTAIQSVTYQNTSDDPSIGVRTVGFKVNDGDIDSVTISRNIAIAAVNDTPVITPVDDEGAVTEDTNLLNLSDTGSVTFADVDVTNALSSSVVLMSTSTTGPAIPSALSLALASSLALIQPGTNNGSIAWTFTLANSLTQYLAASETVAAIYTLILYEKADSSDERFDEGNSKGETRSKGLLDK